MKDLSEKYEKYEKNLMGCCWADSISISSNSSGDVIHSLFEYVN